MASIQPLAMPDKDMFFEGIKSSVSLDVADSNIPGAGLGLYVRKEVPAGTELFRATLPTVSAV